MKKPKGIMERGWFYTKIGVKQLTIDIVGWGGAALASSIIALPAIHIFEISSLEQITAPEIALFFIGMVIFNGLITNVLWKWE